MSTRIEVIGVGIALVLLASVSVLWSVTTTRIVETARWVGHTHEVMVALGEVGGAATSVESLAWRFDVTGEDLALSEYSTAAAAVTAGARRVRELTADNPVQQARATDLERRLRDRVAALDGAIAARRADPAPADRPTPAAGRSAAAHDVLVLVEEMIAEEQGLLDERERMTEASVRRARLVHTFGLLVSLGLVSLAAVRLRRILAARERAEEQRRVSEESLSITLHSIGDGVIATDTRGVVTRMNAVAERLTGWSGAEAVGKRFGEVFHIVHETTRRPAVDPVARALGEGVAVALENHTLLLARDGREWPIADSAAPIRDAAGVVAGAVLVFRETSAEREAADQILEAKRFVDSIVENVPHMIFVKDAVDLRFERFNRAGEELLGLSRDQLLGRTDLDLFPREQAEAFQARDREVLAGRAVVTIPEEPITTPQGRRWLLTKKIPLFDADGRPSHLLGISLDITDRKATADELEQRVVERTAELRAKEQQLLHAQKMEAVGRLAGGVAHDFNNLLSVILSCTSFLSEGRGGDDPATGDLAEIRSAAERASALTRQLLAFSRQQVLAPQVIDLNDVIAGIEKMIRRLIGEDVAIRTVAAPRLGRVKADPGQIEQILVNLAVNARDAMPRGGTLTIETAVADLDATYAVEHADVKPGPYVMVAVTDTGTGMDAATRARIFEPFFTTKEVGKGTGLGLSTVFGIVKQSGGHIWVYSEPSQGTVFKIYLPRLPEGAEVEDATEPLGARPEDPPASATILLVEDEAPVRHVARRILTRRGYQVIDAVDGEEALLLAERFSGPIALVVTDLVMPTMGGRELAQRLQERRPEVRILLMSGYTDDVVVRTGALEAGFAFLQKPFTPEALAASVAALIDPPSSRPRGSR